MTATFTIKTADLKKQRYKRMTIPEGIQYPQNSTDKLLIEVLKKVLL